MYRSSEKQKRTKIICLKRAKSVKKIIELFLSNSPIKMFYRNTDVCSYCKNAHSLKRELIRYAVEHNFYFENSSHFADNCLKSKYFEIDELDLNCKNLIEHFSVFNFDYFH